MAKVDLKGFDSRLFLAKGFGGQSPPAPSAGSQPIMFRGFRGGRIVSRGFGTASSTPGIGSQTIMFRGFRGGRLLSKGFGTSAPAAAPIPSSITVLR